MRHPAGNRRVLQAELDDERFVSESATIRWVADRPSARLVALSRTTGAFRSGLPLALVELERGGQAQSLCGSARMRFRYASGDR